MCFNTAFSFYQYDRKAELQELSFEYYAETLASAMASVLEARDAWRMLTAHEPNPPVCSGYKKNDSNPRPACAANDPPSCNKQDPMAIERHRIWHEARARTRSTGTRLSARRAVRSRTRSIGIGNRI
ncbi:hypothetical protein EVJ58_g8003 [Rhodofomes roseus]|uniref:Uncharacterized protein n=1 Tax=Rhodofomes roseus TaxID=34475 RepID=A0A4Y9Y0G2_9APHY|nr:hypothetical protein EVJ58_g8003 [Rhodofomes roseus]